MSLPVICLRTFTINVDSLVPASSIPPEGNFEDDLQKLPELLEDDEPAYILARLDGPGVEWLTISYVPDTAKVRDKVCLCLAVLQAYDIRLLTITQRCPSC